ncbi:MAG: cytidylate kinase-like family protein [Deltaproteobacteria bacterium]|nr:cytidylate kinase-like family protein [Deltaproteobacteria bacterium]
MKRGSGAEKYLPGTYSRKGRNAAELSDEYIKRWLQKPAGPEEFSTEYAIPPSICLSREIGVGALEIADALSRKIGFRVLDREILELIAEKAGTGESAVFRFDERYLGKRYDFFLQAFTKKPFAKTQYLKHLFNVVTSIATEESCIFVGRGVHHLLSGNRILAVRIIASKDYRIKRIKELMAINEKQAEERIEEVDREQKEFFKNIYGQKHPSDYDFDLIINRNLFTEEKWVVEVMEQAFKQKFGA